MRGLRTVEVFQQRSLVISFLPVSGWLIFLAVLVTSLPPVLALRNRRMQKPAAAPPHQPDGRPHVSVIMPARNEGAMIAEAIRTVLSTQLVDFELILVNDRSTDDTGAVMDRAAVADSRVRVIHISDLPAGWLGKNHAMHTAAENAAGEFLLFTDGDILYQPETIAAAVEYANREQLQHLCLLPRMIPGSLIENVLTTFFGMCFAIGMQLHLIRTRFPLSYAGVGAFNMIRADFYRQCGGHLPIRMDVLDDVKLGKLAKRSGGRSDFLLAEDWLSVRWQPSLWGVICGLEKNGFASLNYSLLQISLVTVLFTLIFVLPFAIPAVAIAGILTWEAAAGFAATAILWHLLFLWLVASLPQGVRMVPFFLAGPWLMAFAYWRSAVITLRQGGVRWRDSFYSLTELRSSIYH